MVPNSRGEFPVSKKVKNVKSLQITLQLLMNDSRHTDQELSSISREIRHLEAGSSTEL